MLAAASLVGGLAPSLEVLVGARAAQGLGAALAAPNALAILSQTFEEGPERHRALGIFGAAGGTAAAGSSVLSGVIVQGPGWPWAFFLNVPVGLVLAALILRYVPADPARERRARADLRGALTLTVGLMAIAFGVHQSIEAGWLSAATLAPLLGGLALLALFVRNEGRSATPLIPLRRCASARSCWPTSPPGCCGRASSASSTRTRSSSSSPRATRRWRPGRARCRSRSSRCWSRRGSPRG